ncbi:hypothetical protein ACFSCX_18360 [Bacillus salitolerans]|uniref:DUF2524 family protein n=1 Tax=Bacillus salitolerans TaxID=1437434 RepID=A0ABW4LV77_9BACI
MESNQQFNEVLEAVHSAEEAVYHAQANSNPEDFQQADQKVKLAKEKVHAAQTKLPLDNAGLNHRLHQAQEHLKHLEEAEQSLLDR